MKRKYTVSGRDCERIYKWWKSQEAIENPDKGFELEIDLPDEQGSDNKDLSETEKKLVNEITRLWEQNVTIKNRLDAIDKLDGLGGLNLRLNNVEELLKYAITTLHGIEKKDSLQSESKEDNPDIETIAALCHSQWSGWMEYLFSKCGMSSESKSYEIPQWAVERWTRQMNTPYSELSEEEKESDRVEARKFIYLFGHDDCREKQSRFEELKYSKAMFLCEKHQWASNSEECPDCQKKQEDGKAMSQSFEEELRKLINKTSIENQCDTPDFILSNYIMQCLNAFSNAVNKRKEWFGRSKENGDVKLSDCQKKQEVRK